jgi:hypothetical protein
VIQCFSSNEDNAHFQNMLSETAIWASIRAIQESKKQSANSTPPRRFALVHYSEENGLFVYQF